MLQKMVRWSTSTMLIITAAAILVPALALIAGCDNGHDLSGDPVCDPNSPNYSRCVYDSNH